LSDLPTPEVLLRMEPPKDVHHLMGRGHPVGDILEAHEWRILERGLGHLRVAAHLPDAVRNPRGQLFGGFTATYIDFLSIFTFWSGREAEHEKSRGWLATLNLRVDYFQPVMGPRFEMEGRVVHMKGTTAMIETRFFAESPDVTTSADGVRSGTANSPLVYGYATLKVTG
jgi:acyl-coenzyme A thioesterase PaaI-like protein